MKHLFSLSGNQILSVYDATIGRDIELIHTRHEAAAVHMADGWGRLTDEPGVALLTAGPGHCNGLGALYVALMAESPLLMLSGHCPEAQIGTGAFQEVDQVAAARPVAKASWRVERCEDLADNLSSALEMAVSGRPGPVHLSLPSDVLEASAPRSRGVHSKRADGLMDADLDAVLALLSEAERPLILAGPAMGRSGRWLAVERLGEATGIPALPMESPRGVNDPALRRAVTCLASADVVLLLGKKLDFSLRFGRPPFFSEQRRFIQIDAEPGELRADACVALRLLADPSEATLRLADMALARSWNYGTWRLEVESLRGATPSDWDGMLRRNRRPRASAGGMRGGTAFPGRGWDFCERWRGVRTVGAGGTDGGDQVDQRAIRRNRERAADGSGGKAGASGKDGIRVAGGWDVWLSCDGIGYGAALWAAGCRNCR